MQTAQDADKLGLNYTTRTKGDFSNNLYSHGRGFCITVYQALVNAKSVFKGTLRPEAIIFDDAHVAQRVIRDSYTLRIEKKKHGGIFDPLMEQLKAIISNTKEKQHFVEVFRKPPMRDLYWMPPL